MVAPALPDWPLIRHSAVFHVGELDPLLKGSTHNATSLEGTGLSVSLHPQAWREIARLGGSPVWRLLPPNDTAAFVDALALQPEHWEVALEWAATEGLVEACELLEVSWFDDEVGERRAMQFDHGDPAAAEEAKQELAEREGMDARIERLQAFRATQVMQSRVGYRVDPMLVRDLALTLYVEEVLAGLKPVHGVWWDEEFDPHVLSAPRGTIHLRALSSWAREPSCSDSLNEHERSRARP